MQQDELNKIWKQAAEKMNWPAFFKSQGLRFDDEATPDKEGWVEVSGCVFNQSKIQVNIQNGKWRDLLTEKSGNIFTFLNKTHRLRDDNYDALTILCEFVKVPLPERATPPNPEDATEVSEEILSQITERLRERHTSRIHHLTGVTAATLKRYRVGWFPAAMTGADRTGEISIPIPEADGTIKAMRVIDENLTSRWLRKIPRANKLESKQMMFGLDELQVQNWKNIIVTNSELDRLILMQEKPDSAEDWGVISIIDSYSKTWNQWFHGRNVVLIFSSDHYSLAAAQNVVAPMMKHDVDKSEILSLKHIKLAGLGTPEDSKVYHWFKNGGTWEALMKLESFQPQYELPGRGSKNSDRKNLVYFTEIDDPANNGLKVRVPITITGEYNHVYDSIETFKVESCIHIRDRSCMKCDGIKFEIDPTSPKHLAAYEANEKTIMRLCVEHCCDWPSNRPTIGSLTRSTFRKVIATQCFSTLVDRDRENNGTIIDGRKERLVEKHIVVMVPAGKSAPIEPRSYMATGAVHTNPVDSTRSMVVESLEPIPEEYETFNFKLHSSSLETMKNIGWKGIVADLVAHRTKMFGYDELMILNLLAFCSPLRFHFNGERDRRGWLNVCILGDTGVGKSKTFEDLSKMTGLGSIFNAKNGARTGFTHASIKMGSAGFRIQAGLLPLSSRKILLLEETQRLEEGALTSMSDAMYDGWLNVNMSARAKYESMTRLIMNCNCKLNKPLDDYALGCLALKDLFDHTFIRRIDVAAFIRKMDDVPKYHAIYQAAGEPIVTPEMMKHLIYYAWNLTADRIEFSAEVTAHIMARSMEMIAKFGKPDDITLVYVSDFRLKLARISLAWAVLALSSSDGFKTVEVQKEHVDLSVALLTNLYAHPDCGLDKYSEQWARSHSIEDYELIRDDFKAKIVVPDAAEVGEHSRFARYVGLLRSGVYARRNEISRMLHFDFKWVEEATNYLLDHNLVRLELDRVKVTSKFNRVLEKMEREDKGVFVHIRAASLNAEIEKTKEAQK